MTTEITTDAAQPRFTLYASENELNSYLFSHVFNWVPVVSDDDLDTITGYMDCSFGQDNAFGIQNLFLIVVDNTNQRVPVMRMRIPLAEKKFEYFHVLPAHAELEPYIKDLFVPKDYEYNGQKMRAAHFDKTLALAEGMARLATHPRFSELKADFDPLTPPVIEELNRKDSKFLSLLKGGATYADAMNSVFGTVPTATKKPSKKAASNG
jgi:hypothetical protein